MYAFTFIWILNFHTKDGGVIYFINTFLLLVLTDILFQKLDPRIFFLAPFTSNQHKLQIPIITFV